GHDEPIRCKLREVLLDDGVQYGALSYVWGGSAQQRTVEIGGMPCAVTDNLYAALHSLRRPDAQRTMWIDALCIKQSDPEEKTSHVNLMHKIHSKSTSSVIRLGEF
ncbi:heterokaryon incompatibility protein-domain-containing protein, partial [Macrophomina phaseolina]